VLSRGAKGVTSAGVGIGIRARLDVEQSLVLSGKHLKSPPQGGGRLRQEVWQSSSAALWARNVTAFWLTSVTSAN
jgi:hypothetical protein